VDPNDVPPTPIAEYGYGPGDILTPVAFSTTLDNGTVSGAPAGPWADDYGDEEATTAQWVNAFRTLALAMRLRVIGLPSGQFMAPGKVYAAQIRYDLDAVPKTEQDFVNLERQGAATHVSLDAVREAGSKTFFAVPDGSDKLELASNLLPASGLVPASFCGGSSADYYVHRFMASADAGAGGRMGRLIVPYTAGADDSVDPSRQDSTNQQVADQTMVLVMGIFGLQDDTILEVSYGKIIEYVPTPSAPPGIETAVQLPSAPAMDALWASIAMLSALRGRLFQSPGDKTITTDFSGATPSAVTEARRIRSTLAARARRLIGTAVPMRREGFWDFDWLSRGSLGGPGSGMAWNFSGKK
jgi:hypothetical protein